MSNDQPVDIIRDQFDIHPTAYVFPQAFLSGTIIVGAESSIWPMCVLRGDREPITIGAHCNVQDGCIIHCDPGYPTVLGNRVTLGHAAIVHGARLEDEVLIGIGAVVLNGAVIGSGSIVGARALVTEGTHVPPGSLVLGIPGRVRPLPPEHRERMARTAQTYVEHKERYRRREQG